MSTTADNARTVSSTRDERAIRTPWSEFWRKFRKQHVALAAGLFVLVLIVVSIVGPHIVPYDPENYFDYDALNAGPTAAHWFGVDSLGRDIFSRIVAGTRISLAAGFVSVAIGAVPPAFVVAIGIVAILGNGMINVIAAVAVFSIPAFARLVRGNTLMLKQLTYIEAARSIGASDWTIIMRHILPGTISSVVVYLTMRIGTSIITAASLSFLGLGAQPPTPEWGAMLNEARADMAMAPHVAIFPSLAIFFTVLAFNLLGDGLRDALDPKLDRP